MIPAVDLQPHDQAVIDAIETIGKPVGFAEAPDGALDGVRDRTGPDYVIVYPLSGLRRPSSANDSVGDADLVYQTTVVARRPDGARWLVSRIETALYGIAIPGRSLVRITPDEIGDVRPDDDITPPVFIATPRWRLWTTTP